MFARHAGRHRHDEPRRRERLRARPQEVLGIGVRQLGAHPAQGPERRIDGGGLAEGNQPPPRRGHGADLQVPRRLRRLRRHEPEAQRRPLGRAARRRYREELPQAFRHDAGVFADAQSDLKHVFEAAFFRFGVYDVDNSLCYCQLVHLICRGS